MYEAPQRATRFPGRGGPDAVHNRVVAHSQPAKRMAQMLRAQYASAPRMEAASSGAIARAHASNRNNPNLTLFTPEQSRMADSLARHNSPLSFLGNKAENFLQLKKLGQGITQEFDPRTRAGLVNALSLFAGGAKDGMDDPLMARGLQPYNIQKANESGALRGIEMPNVRNTRVMGKGTGIRGLVRRSQGVGGYRRPVESGQDILNRIEQQRAHLSEQSIARQKQQDAANAVGFGRKQQVDRAVTDWRLEQELGAHLIPYRAKSVDRIGDPETDAGGEYALENFAPYLMHYLEKGDNFDIGSQRAMHDRLFGGTLFRFPGPGGIPRRP